MTKIINFKIWLTYSNTILTSHNEKEKFVEGSFCTYWPLNGVWYA